MRSLLSLTLALAAPFGATACTSIDGQSADDDHDDHGSGWADIGEEIDDESADGESCAAFFAPDPIDFGGKVAFTFDDGPHNQHTPTIIDTLRAHDAPGAFFMLGSRVASYRPPNDSYSIASLQAAPDIIVANHSWDHPNIKLMSTGAARDEQVARSTAALEAFGADIKHFRFPYGNATCKQIEMVEGDQGLINTGWHVDSGDWCYASGGTCTPKEWPAYKKVPEIHWSDMQCHIMAQLARTNGGIILFHDIHGFTADALPGLLQAMESAGYSFTSIDDIEAFPRLNGVSDAPVRRTVKTGASCSADSDCDLGAFAFLGFCHPEGYCTTACKDGGCRGGMSCGVDAAVSTEYSICHR